MRLRTLSVILGVWVLAGLTHAQTLEQTAGPPGAAFSGAAERNGEMIASGRTMGVFARSGEEWSALPVGTRLGRLFSLGETFFASSVSSFHRSDDGAMWESVFETSVIDVSVTADSVLVLANDSVFVSADGREWRNVLSGRDVVDEEGTPTGDQLHFLNNAVRTPDGKIWVVAFSTSTGGIFFSEDGAAWREASDGLPEFASPNGLFASTSGVLITDVGGDVYQFDETVQEWVERANGLPPFSANLYVEAQGEVYVLARSSTTTGLYRLDETAWTEIDLPSETVVEVAPSEEGLFAVTTDGLYEKIGEGVWEPLQGGLVASSATPFALGAGVAAYTSGGWMKTTDEGATWQPMDVPDGVTGMYDAEGGVVIGTSGDGAYRSLDGGETWQTANSGIDVGPFHKVDLRHVAARNGTIYGGLYSFRSIEHQGGETLGGVYRSTNDAQSWALFGSGYPTNVDGLPAGVYQLGVTESYLIASTQEGLYRIPHTGGAWESLDAPAAGAAHAIESDGSRVVLMTFTNVIVSEDDGATWSPLAEGLPAASYRQFLAERDGKFYLLIFPRVGEDPVSGLFVLGENGWVNTGVEIPEWMSWRSMVGLGEDLYLGSANHGVWRVTDFTIGNHLPETPTDVAALSVFPNPARRDATLSLRLPSASDVQIALFDATGRRVATLHADELAAHTGHRFDIDASKLAPGVYVVRAEGDGVRLNRTFTVVR